MKKVLRIDSSVFANQGVSSQLAEQLQTKLMAEHAGLAVVKRVFADQPIPHVDGAHIAALMTPAEQRSLEQQQAIAYSDSLIAEVKDADAIILTAPMYNFQIPSMLKAWFDHLARAGETFNYTEQGPVGLLANKPVYVLTTRGGIHRHQASDTIETYLKTMLAFLGLTDVRMIYAEGLNLGSDARNQAIAIAKQQIAELA